MKIEFFLMFINFPSISEFQLEGQFGVSQQER